MRSISLSGFHLKITENSGLWSSKPDRTGERGYEGGSLQGRLLASYAPKASTRTYFGVASLKEVGLSSGFSRFFFFVCPGSGRTLYAEALGFSLNVFFRTRGSSFRGR